MAIYHLWRWYVLGGRRFQSRIPAYHEAGHVVLAVASEYHSLPPLQTLIAGDYGETWASLSQKKCAAHGKVPVAADPEIAEDAAIIFLGGLAAERRFCDEIGTTASIELAKNDYRLTSFVLRQANITTPLTDLENRAARRVEELWRVIAAFADELSRRKSIDAVDALDFIEDRL